VVATASLRNATAAFSRARFAVGRDRIFEVDDHGVGAARHCTLELFRVVGRREQKTNASISGRIRIKTWRRHSATSLFVLIIGAVMELDDAGARPRFRFAFAKHFRWCNARYRLRRGDGGI